MEQMCCRLCGCELFPAPLLVLKDIPKAAQYLPSKDECSADKGIDLTICQCSGCGLVQLTNEPVAYYREVITSAAWSEKMLSFRRRQMRDFIGRFGLAGKTVVEVGSGQGYLLDILEQYGASAVGVEGSAQAVAAGKQAGRKVIKGYLDSQCRIEGHPFDSFVSINFLEHAPDPDSLLRGIYHNLTGEAVGLVEVPNLEKVLANKRYYDFVADHLSYFTTETLAFALERNGFTVLDCQPTWGGDDIVATVKKKEPLDMAKYAGELGYLIAQLNGIVRQALDNNRKVAVWGASHQALTLLTLAGLREGIGYIVDSAVFKQGKYAPVIHIPIVSPETLRENRPDLIIVMAAGYSDEVVKIIQDKRLGIDIAILRENNIEFIQRTE